MSEPLACSLPDAETEKRLAAIADLARRALLAHQQYGSTVHLQYAGTVAGALEELVAQERRRCPFLNFELLRCADTACLFITARAGMSGVAPALISHFIGKPASRSACTASCGCRPVATA